ncbi:cyclin-D3-3 [Cajanus cajan]|uniref:B-like cyclin n=1 Tax=Cajanus cajan TaxID=3821 RepID=A0A151SCF7_CAJCA|nr:cyclin-D3-3 [Cajanus cajan]KYP52441.1 Cyclin-D3-2 [Cajanus cajan]
MPQPHSPSFLFCQEQHHHLLSLLSKEKPTHFSLSPRHHALRFISTLSNFHAFSPLTTVLAVNYFHRFAATLTLHIDKPWITHLAALACVSLAAKLHETHVPLLFHLQMEESEFVFEAKTIQRMELVVLSTLQWRMNPVTPVSFFQHILTTLPIIDHREFLCRCQRVLLSVIADSRVMSYLPSILAAAIMMHVIKEIEPFNATEYRIQIIGLLKSSEEQVNECYKLVLRRLVCCDDNGIHNLGQRCKRLSEPCSPAGIIDASFSCECSSDSWTVASVSVEPVFKRSKVQE